MTFGPGSSIRVVGHRGAAGVAPENTLPSLRHAVRAGAHAVEFDVQCTSDGQLVVLHDSTVDRTTDGSGRIDDMPFEEARRLDAGYRFTSNGGGAFPFRARGVRIPTLTEAFAEIGDDVPVVMEIKSQRAGERLPGWLSEHDVAARTLVGSFSRSALEAAAPYASWRCASEEELRSYVLLGKVGLAGASVPDADAVMVPERRRGIRIVTPRFVRRAHRDGLGVFVWTVNRPDAMRRLWEWGVDGLISNEPGRALRILRERIVAGAED
jgi:glycerophosphoryl diester phosphodiesterase